MHTLRSLCYELNKRDPRKVLLKFTKEKYIFILYIKFKYQVVNTKKYLKITY